MNCYYELLKPVQDVVHCSKTQVFFMFFLKFLLFVQRLMKRKWMRNKDVNYSGRKWWKESVYIQYDSSNMNVRSWPHAPCQQLGRMVQIPLPSSHILVVFVHNMRIDPFVFHFQQPTQPDACYWGTRRNFMVSSWNTNSHLSDLWSYSDGTSNEFLAIIPMNDECIHILSYM
jgi:hypothetical protein